MSKKKEVLNENTELKLEKEEVAKKETKEM